ncbi:hypothetical protein Scep_004758 [Stephania cephalantha]|uniref:Arginine decarboxylase n=1 Tax=Stephania cephalantha TaxID=152367 RepID=A0AAP0PXK7_9MAGN
MRVKLRTKHAGHFGSTSGEKGKFELTTAQVLHVAKRLETEGMLGCLQLLHFHIGSQIPSTALLADGVGEAAQIYCELVRLSAGMRVIDVGASLGVDYDGSRSPNLDNSIGYDVQEYAAAVVQAIRLACDRKFVKHPIISSESSRALISHHSVLIFEAVTIQLRMCSFNLWCPASNHNEELLVCDCLSHATSSNYAMLFENLVKNNSNAGGPKVEDAEYFHTYIMDRPSKSSKMELMAKAIF